MTVKPVYEANAPEDYARLGIEPRSIAQFEDGLRTGGEPGSYEWWYFDAHLDDGAKVVVVFYTKHYTSPELPLTPMLEINLELPDGRAFVRQVTLAPEEFHAAKDRCDVRIGDAVFEGDLHTYRIKAEVGELAVDLKLVGEVPAWRPGSGHLYFGEGEERRLFAWLPAVPKGHVTGSYSVDGEQHIVTGGNGYHDHNWGDAPMVSLMHDWYWGRGEAGDYSVITAYITAEEEYGFAPTTYFMLAKGEEIVADNVRSVVAFSTDEVAADPKSGKPVADVSRYISSEGSERYAVTFTRDKTIVVDSMLDLMTPDRREAAQATGFDGAYHRFLGELEIAHERDGARVDAVAQEALWELMYFGRARRPAV
ncbi:MULTISPECIES: lipocalin-like domain-containing protein [Streptomyces]|uniref:Lipocalin-like domain-containing protein n=1 Tax=Streptomyces sp. 900129855 TaxID=3155129 RepID=A0ABV3A097_9ACTN